MRYATLMLALVLTCPAQGQLSEYMEEGYAFGAGFYSSDTWTELAASGTYLFSPVFGAGIGVARRGVEESDFSATSVGPFVSVYPVRQSEEIPLSIYLGGNVRFVSFGGSAVEVLEAEGVKLSSTIFGFEVGAYHRIDLSEVFWVVPYAGGGYEVANNEVEGPRESETASDEYTYFTMSGSLVFGKSERMTFVLTPSATFGSGDSTFGLSMSLVFPQ